MTGPGDQPLVQEQLLLFDSPQSARAAMERLAVDPWPAGCNWTQQVGSGPALHDGKRPKDFILLGSFATPDRKGEYAPAFWTGRVVFIGRGGKVTDHGVAHPELTVSSDPHSVQTTVCNVMQMCDGHL